MDYDDYDDEDTLISISAFWNNDCPDGIAVQIRRDQWEAADDFSELARLIEEDAKDIIADKDESAIIQPLRDLASRKDNLGMDDSLNVVSTVRALALLGHTSDDFNGVLYMRAL